MRTIAPIALALALAAPAAAQTAPAGNFLAISDIHLDGGTPPCTSNDTTPALWQAAQKQIARLIDSERPAFAVYVGDLPAHCQPVPPPGDLQTPLDDLAALAGTRLKLFYVPGNNDSLAGDYQPFTTARGTPLDLSAPWRAGPVLNAAPGDMIDVTTLPMGYYSAYAFQKTATAPALRMIVLNTNMFTAAYGCAATAACQAASNAQLEWLEAQLAAARSNGEKAMLAMHVPPGTDGSASRIRTMWDQSLAYTGGNGALESGWVQKTYLAIVARYTAEIVGTLSSHTHYNEIRRLRDCSKALPALGAFTELDLAIPSITTDHGNNPTLKTIAFDGQHEWIENTTWYARDKSGTAWTQRGGQPAPLSFDRTNYPCPGCAAGDTLRARIAALDSATRIGTSTALAAMMVKWVRPGARPAQPSPQYTLALDATCEVPTPASAR